MTTFKLLQAHNFPCLLLDHILSMIAVFCRILNRSFQLRVGTLKKLLTIQGHLGIRHDAVIFQYSPVRRLRLAKGIGENRAFGQGLDIHHQATSGRLRADDRSPAQSLQAAGKLLAGGGAQLIQQNHHFTLIRVGNRVEIRFFQPVAALVDSRTASDPLYTGSACNFQALPAGWTSGLCLAGRSSPRPGRGRRVFQDSACSRWSSPVHRGWR